MTTESTSLPSFLAIGGSLGSKPRSRGTTMVLDWGSSPGEQAEACLARGAYVDTAKLAITVPAFLTRDVLAAKLEGYRAAEIGTHPGGMMYEYAEHRGEAAEYLVYCRDAGFTGVEISSNIIALPTDLMERRIEEAVGLGLEVFAEVGRKDTPTDPRALVDEAERALAAGARAVLLEGAELFGSTTRSDVASAMVDRCGLERIIFEVPGAWMTVHRGLYDNLLELMHLFGPEVSLGNVGFGDVIIVATLRATYPFALGLSHVGSEADRVIAIDPGRKA